MPNHAQSPNSFLRDLGASVRVWTRHPFLPLLSVIVASLLDLVDLVALWVTGCRVATTGGCELRAAWELLFFLALPIIAFAFTAGWVGTERIWYLRAFEGKSLRPGEAWAFTFSLMGRFVRLGLFIAVMGLPFALVAQLVPQVGTVVFAIAALLVDLALTFVTPALAFSTHRVLEALSIGIGMIRRHWPASAPFVLIPPFAFLLIIRGLRWALPAGAGLLITVVFGLANLWFKGAVARFYLRHHPTDPDSGAVYSSRDSRLESESVSPEVNRGSEDGA